MANHSSERDDITVAMKSSPSAARTFQTGQEPKPRTKNQEPSAKRQEPGSYQTLQAFSFTMACPALQPQAFWNSGIFCNTPFTRYRPGEWESMLTSSREYSGRRRSHHTRPNPRK